jgi:copper chaperone NosL
MLKLLVGLCLAFFTNCSTPAPKEKGPEEISPDHVCALDGMLVSTHAGPKAQLVRQNGDRAFFCDAKEIFEEVLDPRRGRRVDTVWFQVLDHAPWESHPGGWAIAETLYFVGGSAKNGPMGPTLVPFTEKEKATAFVTRHGGQIYRYQEINLGLIKSLKMQGIDAL